MWFSIFSECRGHIFEDSSVCCQGLIYASNSILDSSLMLSFLLPLSHLFLTLCFLLMKRFLFSVKLLLKKSVWYRVFFLNNSKHVFRVFHLALVNHYLLAGTVLLIHLLTYPKMSIIVAQFLISKCFFQYQYFFQNLYSWCHSWTVTALLLSSIHY